MKKFYKIGYFVITVFSNVMHASVPDYYSYGAVKSFFNNTTMMACGSSSENIWSVARYIIITSAYDPSFGNGGTVVETTLGVSNAYGVTVDSVGNSYVGGWTLVNGQRVWTVIKYTITGARDTTFNATGIVQETGLGIGEVYSVALDKAINPQVIYAIGFTNINNKPVTTIVAYNQDGTHHTSFNP
jgi:hypothetical protein